MSSQLPAVLWILVAIQFCLFYLYLFDPWNAEALTQSHEIVRRCRKKSCQTEPATFIGETTDYSGNYRIVRFFQSQVTAENWEFEDVTLVTQTNLRNLHFLIPLAKR